ncbi:MAG: site-2 protease family protein [Bacteroidota bacterium]
MFERLYLLPILLFSIIVHEISHGWMALRLGDPTARDMGRLTLNPIPHIDPIGSILVPLIAMLSPGNFFIAWAKPVPVNPMYFSNYRRDDILVSIVGPLSNFFMAFVCSILYVVMMYLLPLFRESQSMATEAIYFLINMFAGGITLNIMLAVFNMIPIPPLDGSHVLAAFLPEGLSEQYSRIGFYGIFILILVMQLPQFSMAFHSIIAMLQMPYELLIRSLV